MLFISVINQLDAQNFCFTITLFHACTCFEHMCSSSGGQPVHETATYRCDDIRGCVVQFWPDDEHMCSKHVEAWNKRIVKEKFCASSWLSTEINILRCTVSKTINILRCTVSKTINILRCTVNKTSKKMCIMKSPHRISPETPTFLRFFALFSCIAGQFHDGGTSIAFYIFWNSLFTTIKKFDVKYRVIT